MKKQVANVRLMQKMNRLKVVECVRKGEIVSRPYISSQTGLSLASVTNITAYLLGRQIIKECGMENVARVGRKSMLLSINEMFNTFIHILIVNASVNVVLTDLAGKIIQTHTIETDDVLSPRFLDDVEKAAEDLSHRAPKPVAAVSIGVSGLVLEGSRFVLSSTLKLRSFDLRERLIAKMNIPVYVENISVLRAASYVRGNKKADGENIVFVDMVGGIGSVFISKGAIDRNVLGEIGHTTVEKDGELCFCNNRGCLEAMCSVERITNLYNRRTKGFQRSFNTISGLYNEGDKDAIYAVNECGQYLAIAIANLINLFNPDRLIINDKMYSMCAGFFDKVMNTVKERAYDAVMQKLSYEVTFVDEIETICGSASNLCDRIFDVNFEGDLPVGLP